MSITRRRFVQGSLTAAAAVGLPLSATSHVRGANEDIRVAVVGFHGRGRSHINGFAELEGVRVVALCDVDRDVLGKELANLEKKHGMKAEGFTDVREMLQRDDIDAISTATPNHWHALVSIWAAEAGKDVYVEKPVSHNVWEGRQIVNAARKNKRIIQTGTQSRSSTAIREAIRFVHEGNLGKLKLVTGLCYKARESIGKLESPLQIPDSIDYDIWCGPAQKRDLFRTRVHYDWHWDFNTGNGDLGNQGIHQMDVARWVLGENELSPRVISVGGRLGYKDAGDTPNTQIVFHDYAKAPLIFEVRGLPSAKQYQTDTKTWKAHMDEFHGASIGVIAHCEGGFVRLGDGTAAYDKDGKLIKEFKGGADHFENFITAVRSRNASDLNAEILEGHLSSALCHTGNISYLLGKRLSEDEVKEAMKFNDYAANAMDRMSQHLAANGVKLSKKSLALGETLEMNPKAERFKGNKKANQLLTREYRQPFVVPDIKLA